MVFTKHATKNCHQKLKKNTSLKKHVGNNKFNIVYLNFPKI